jgi:hypothetical protein
MAQTLLAGAGLIAARSESKGPLTNLKAYMIAIIVISTIGILFLLAGLYLYLVTIMQPYEVCLIMGGVILALGLSILASRIFVLYMIQRKIKHSMKAIYEDVKDILEDVVTQASKPVQENPKLAVALAAIAGFILVQKFLKTDSKT